jgi:hypothetical protein
MPASLGPISCVVWGPERADLDRAAIALARAVGKQVFWVEVNGDYVPGLQRIFVPAKKANG